MLRGLGIAGLALAAGIMAAAAQEMKTPRISPTQVDWDAVVAELGASDAPNPDAPRLAAADAMANLNRATGERFANIAASPVPVLLPFDTASFLRERTTAANGSSAPDLTPNPPGGNYLFGFNAVPFFYPGPAGYDAVVVARAQEMRELGIVIPSRSTSISAAPPWSTSSISPPA